MSDDPRTRGTTSTVERRTVVRAAAWTVPVIAASAQAPAFAASCNQLYGGVLSPADPTQYVQSATNPLRRASATIPLTTPGGSVTMSLVSTFNTYTPRSTNLSVHDAPTGGIPRAGIEFGNLMDAADTDIASRNQTIAITFSRTVYNLDFTLTDLDNSGGHRDAVAITGEPFTFATGGAPKVTGTGTVADPFYVNDNVNYNNSDTGLGNVRIMMDGPVTTFSIRYWNIATTNAANLSQSIFLTRLSFQAYMDGCA